MFLLYQVNYFFLYNELIFLIYLHSLQVHIHSMKQEVLLYQVYSNSLSLSSTDVPFKNGKYTHGQKEGLPPAFASLSRSSIQSDSSLFLIIHFIHSLYKSQTTNIILLKEIRITLHLILFLLQYTQSSLQSVTLPTQSQYRKSQNHHPHTPQSFHFSPLFPNSH